MTWRGNWDGCEQQESKREPTYSTFMGASSCFFAVPKGSPSSCRSAMPSKRSDEASTRRRASRGSVAKVGCGRTYIGAVPADVFPQLLIRRVRRHHVDSAITLTTISAGGAIVAGRVLRA